MDELSKAIQAIEERRAAPPNAVLTKDGAPAPLEKADGPDGVLAGYSTRWWVVDSYGEFTIPGAFSKSIAERGPNSGNPKIVLRYEHDWTIGRHSAIQEDDTGVKIEAKISDDGMWGTALRRQLADGVPYGLSIGFRRVKERPANESDPLILDYAPDYIKRMVASEGVGFLIGLEEIKHLEDSAVTFPAVEPATVDSYRSDVLDLTQRHIDALLRDAKAGRLTADHITHLRALAQTLPAASDPDGEMPAPVAPQTAVTRRNYAAELHYALARHGLTDLEIRQ
jgi:HK97 family phage prohead protease